jgi:hypothetical protein
MGPWPFTGVRLPILGSAKSSRANDRRNPWVTNTWMRACVALYT